MSVSSLPAACFTSTLDPFDLMILEADPPDPGWMVSFALLHEPRSALMAPFPRSDVLSHRRHQKLLPLFYRHVRIFMTYPFPNPLNIPLISYP